MRIVPVALVVLLLLLLAGGVVAALSGGGRTARRPRLRQGVRGWLRLAGLLLGLLGAVLVSRVDVLGRGLLVAAPVAAFGLLLGVLAAELAVRPPAGPRRTASLVTRRAADYLPRRLTGTVVATGVTVLVLGVVTTALGSTDDMGRAGRTLRYVCPPFEQGRGPWPGAYYTAPLLVVVVVGVLLALLVLRTTVARPPVPAAVTQGAAPAAQAAQAAQAAGLDTAQRIRSAQAVVAAVGVLLSVPLAGMSLFAGVAVGGMGGCAPAWWTGVGLALGLLALAATGVLLWCVPVALLGRGAPETAHGAPETARAPTGRA